LAQELKYIDANEGVKSYNSLVFIAFTAFMYNL